ncbi:4-hydroxyphenylpyruvate dioxygenase [Thermoflavimicrobium daqui]|jgi:4-hydroxyphenylpyruvate dioxygenase|uniref:4-hydroxyphenylpyruvate dioxygenase n=1 Tax=Thermoflavimicrobium daqui TaxID=2137476 RepID=A0A364K6F9_9BACL|nr:4-hydroxyphenylpyruvate dioxygenase [Thermoflavimicrobium daqui]RAL25883.1 4-hydroxyphenylpyruvate dioxygenase [Thermoflavimicrobium daqui]
MRRKDNFAIQNDFLPIQDVDYLELYTGNAKQACFFLCQTFGFQPIAYSGLESGNREKVSYVVKQGNIHLVISGSYTPDHEIADFVKNHGDGIKDIALRVPDVEKAFSEVKERGAIVIREPFEEKDEFGVIKKAVIGTYGDTVHTLIERKGYKGLFAPGFIPCDLEIESRDTGIVAVDHVVGNVETMEEWVSYYEKVMGFKQMIHFDDEDISTEYSALMSKVMHNGGRIKFPINEPAEGKRKSQIQEYLDFYKGAGVQHIALLTNDIVKTVAALKENGVPFLKTPDTYYEALSDRVGNIDEPIEDIRKLSILVDRDDEGYLLQIFTQPIVDRPTLFFEIIQRKGSKGFGDGNFKALFEAIEREQARRGNL